MNAELNRREFLDQVTKTTALLAVGLPSLTSAAESLSSHDGPGQRFNFSLHWEFTRPDEGDTTGAGTPANQPPPANAVWQRVCLPHSVRLEPINASGGRNYQGVCWYRKSFAADPAWADKIIYLHFEGAMQVADIWLNGQKLLTHYGGYLPFTVDLTGKLLQAGRTNELVVRLDNSDNPEVPPGKPQRALDFCYFGGLYRGAWLETLNSLHISDEYLASRVAGGGIFVKYPEVSARLATVEVKTEVQNDGRMTRNCTVEQEIIGANGQVVATATQVLAVPDGQWRATTQSLRVDQPLLWHPNHPHLYTLRTVVHDGNQTLDERLTRIGLRRFQFTKEGLFINGEKFFSLGANRHQDHPYVGYALPPSAHYRDARKLREAGFTSVRSHYPQDPSFMHACDELGTLAIVSNPGWQFYGDQVFVERSLQNVREMVRRDRNHPCVLMWEAILNETSYPAEFCRAVYDIVHAEYPGDQCFAAGDGKLGDGEHILDVLYKEPDWNDVDQKPHWIREWGDEVDNWHDQQSRVRVDRAWGELPMIEQTRTHLGKLDSLPKANLGGADLWAGIDCNRGYHHQPFFGGPLDLFRLPKFDYYFFQSQRPPEVILSEIDSGPMVFIASYSTPYSPSTVTVFSNCEQVRFYENGTLLATQKPDPGHLVAHPPFSFETNKRDTERSTYYMTNVENFAINAESFMPAGYRAQGLIGGKVVAEHSVHVPGVMSQIELVLDECGRQLTADGADWIRVYARVCDQHGVINPFSDDLVTFSAEGPGNIINDARIAANPVEPRFGIATALLQAGTEPGRIRVSATAFGLASGETVIETRAMQEKTL